MPTRRRTRFASASAAQRRYAAADPATVRALSSAVDRLSALVERLVAREAPATIAESTPARAVLPQRTLTPRELEVARLIVEGLSTSQIAARLVVEAATVKTHRRGIARKCGTSSQAGLEAKRERWDYPRE
jgi:DNA-binding NarL/FixJ family response regulator